MSLFYVYLYKDPRPGKQTCPVYVGKGKALLKKGRKTEQRVYERAYSHWRKFEACSNYALRKFLISLSKQGLVPIIKIYRTFDCEEAAHRCEIRLIAKYGRRDLGLGSLFNNTDGGEGTVGYWIEKHRKRQSKYGKRRAKERWAKPEEKEKLIAQSKARWADPEFRVEVQPKMKASAVRRASDPKWRKAHSLRLKKLWKDPEFRGRQLAFLKNRNFSDEFREMKRQEFISLQASKTPEERVAQAKLASAARLRKYGLKRAKNPKYVSIALRQDSERLLNG